jgi:hypothetical protein
MTTTNQNLMRSYHSGMEKHDLEAFMQCYDANAEVRIVDQNHPPKAPLVLQGTKAIRDFYSDILGRNLNHKIEMEAVGDDAAAFTDVCDYPNGARVIATDMCQIKNGKISKQMTVQVWDQ